MQVEWLRRTLRNFEEEAAHIARDNPQAAAALVSQADYLVTRNPRDFRQSLVPVVTPSEFLALLA